MIVVDPSKRIDSAEVFARSEEMMKVLAKQPKFDCILVNEDIYEKLSLVDYHKYFCTPLNKKPVSKVYFAIQEYGKDQKAESAAEKFFYFAELCYWIMNIPKVTTL